MKNIFAKISKVIATALAFLVLTGCGAPFAGSASAQDKPVRSAWLVYWDLDNGEKDLRAIDQRLDRLVYFCAYFDEIGHLFIPPEILQRKSEIEKKKRRYEPYLSFVNDKKTADETITLKDIELLRRLFADNESMEKHIEEIIALTLQGGFAGIEIDYERIWRDENIGQSFLKFAGKLYEKARQNNLKLRIVLEPGATFFADYVRGPEYVLMFYNLYGLHSEPGPKANMVFIQELIKKAVLLPGEKSIAISTGGCLWGDNGVKKFISEAEAAKLAKTYKATTKRDADSQCLVFSYQEQDVSYTVWYADVKTLNNWLTTADEQGWRNISIWRLGGNINLNKIK